MEVFFLEDWVILSTVEIRLDEPIKAIYLNATGAAIVVVDQTNNIFLFSSVGEWSRGYATLVGIRRRPFKCRKCHLGCEAD